MNRVARITGIIVVSFAVDLFLIGSSPGAQKPAEAEVAEHFRAGQRDMREGRPKEAVEQFQEVLRLAPGLSEAHINLGLAYHLLADYKPAAAELEAGLRDNQDLPGPNIVLGLDELKLGDPAKAIPPLKKALELDPSNQQAGGGLAEAYLALGNYAEAGRAYREAFQSRAGKAEDWLHLGKAYLQMSSLVTARMAHEYPESAWSARLAGDFLSERGLLREAAERYRRALARDPSQPGLHESLGNVLLEQGSIDGGEREFRSEIRLNPLSPRSFLGLSQIELAEGYAKRALEYVSQAAEVSPEFLEAQTDFPAPKPQPASAEELVRDLADAQTQVGAHYLLAALYAAAGDRAEAARQRAASDSDLKRLGEGRQAGQAACKNHDYARCLAFLEKSHRIDSRQYLTLGRAFFALREYEKATDAFASALNRHGVSGETIYWLARADSAAAESCFSQLAAAFPDSAQTHELQAETYRARGEDDKAIEQYRLAAALEPDNADLYEALGALCLKGNKPTAAESELMKSYALNPTSAETLYLLGRVNIGLEKPETAIGYLQQALHYNPSLLEAHASLGIAFLRAGEPALAVAQLVASESLDYYGDLHYTLYQAYKRLGRTGQAQSALAISQSLRKKTEARDQALIRAAEAGGDQP